MRYLFNCNGIRYSERLQCCERFETYSVCGCTETDVKGIALAAAKMPKKNGAKPRMVVITQGSLSTIVATPDGVEEFAVPSGVKVVDTNGAGDAFCGGFFSGLMQGKSIKDSVNCGHYTAGVVIGRSGCQYSDADRYSFPSEACEI